MNAGTRVLSAPLSKHSICITADGVTSYWLYNWTRISSLIPFSPKSCLNPQQKISDLLLPLMVLFNLLLWPRTTDAYGPWEVLLFLSWHFFLTLFQSLAQQFYHSTPEELSVFIKPFVALAPSQGCSSRLAASSIWLFLPHDTLTDLTVWCLQTPEFTWFAAHARTLPPCWVVHSGQEVIYFYW